MERYAHGNFKDGGIPVTVTAQWITKENVVSGKNAVNVLIMDTPGGGIDLTLVTMTATVFVLIVFDVTDKKSFENIDPDFITTYNNACTHQNRIIYIVGNKTDKGSRQVTEDQGRELAEMYGLKYFEVSAKTGTNIE